ncbi:hypothetical protein HPB50_012386 [Hyalomma asiaticum]|uniref:Uncharacterized protein n=1 Tax=Hyalomma asiaticum TaxID=266040 RepID=A0ACB7SMC3_HYAAI|nr:hypothetical protein HPB50_012386 [Hyalomma asiaticum]
MPHRRRHEHEGRQRGGEYFRLRKSLASSFDSRPSGPQNVSNVVMDDLEASSSVPLPEEMDLQDPGDIGTSPDALTLTTTAADATAAIATLRTAPLRPDVNPFDVLADPETPKDGKGKCDNLLVSNVLILPTSKHGQKRARGTLSASAATAAAKTKPAFRHNVPRCGGNDQADFNKYVSDSDAAHDDDSDQGGWQKVYHKRRGSKEKQANTREQRRPYYAHTVILKPQEQCRIMDENFIVLNEAIWNHIITSPSTHRREENPNIVIRYLDKSNQIAVDTDDRETRDALLTLMQLPINGESTRFQAYEALQRDQIRGVIHSAGGMTSEQLMMNLHCRACEIISARPIGARGTAVVTFKGTRLPYKIGLKSFTIRVYPFKSQVYVCETCHKLGHGKQQCPNFKNPRCSVCGRKHHDSDEACPNKMHNNQQAPQSTLEPQPDYEALFSARLMQLEHNIMAKVQTMIERAIETCIRTVMERLMLNGALSFGGVATTSTYRRSLLMCSMAQLLNCGNDRSRGRDDGGDIPTALTRLGQDARQAGTTPDLTWSSKPRTCHWKLLEDPLGSDHLPIAITVKNNGVSCRNSSHKRECLIAHWDEYRTQLQETASITDLDSLTKAMRHAKHVATKTLRVAEDHPDPDRHLLHLWNRRLRLLSKYRAKGRPQTLRSQLLSVQKEIEKYTSQLASEQWMEMCEQINGSTNSSKAWGLLRSLLGRRKTSDGAPRVALKEGITNAELAEKAADVFFPQTNCATDRTYARDDAPREDDDLNQPFTVTEFEDALSRMNTRGAPGADGITQEEALQNALNTVDNFTRGIGLTLAPEKTEFVVIHGGRRSKAKDDEKASVNLSIGRAPVLRKRVIRILGMFLDEQCISTTWFNQTVKTTKQVTQVLRRIAKRTRGVREKEMKHFVQAFIHSRIMYGAFYHPITRTQLQSLERLNNEARIVITGLPKYTPLPALKSCSALGDIADLMSMHEVTQVTRLQSTHAERATLSKIGHDVSHLPVLPHISPSWEHIQIADPKPLPKNTGNEHSARRQAHARSHEKYTQEVRSGSHPHSSCQIVYVDASIGQQEQPPMFATAWTNLEATERGTKLHSKPPEHILRSAPEEIEQHSDWYDPMEAIAQAKCYRRSYLLDVSNPLDIPPLPSSADTRRQQVLLRQRFRRDRDLGTPNIGICGHCNTRADLAHLIWDCPLYSGTRQRVIAEIPPEWHPTSFQAWAQPGRITGAAANELWRSLLEYLDDPKAPAVGTRLRLGRDSQNVNSRDAH